MSNRDSYPATPLDDDVSSFPADDARLNSYREASAQLADFEVPRLVDVNNPSERLYIAAFDGTGNDANNSALQKTNVALIEDQISNLHPAGSQVHLNYLEGPGTQNNFLARAVDGATGHTYGDRLEEMYSDLVLKANEWHAADPDTKIRVASIGFSRGGSQAAGFTNLLHERGIPDLTSRRLHADGSVSYDRHLAPPGKTLQAIGLFDPVATGIPEIFDRRLPSSVISGFQITALDEHRGTFPSDRVIPLGRSADGRFLNCGVAGCHSNIGGGYWRDGLSSRSLNLMVDYLNALRPGAPLLEKVYEPTDPRLNVVHNSREGTWPLYQFDRRVDRSTPEGVNTRLAPDTPAIAGRVVTTEPLPHGPMPLRQPHGLPVASVAIAPVPLDDGRKAALSRQIAAAEAAGLPPPGNVRMANMLAQGAGIATGAGLTALDAYQTHQRASELLAQGNERGATSEYHQAIARNVGGWAGGTGTALALGGSGALPFVAGAASAVVLSAGFEKAVELKENHDIFHHKDPDGTRWKYNGTYWERNAQFEVQPGAEDSVQKSVAASYEKSLELNARANVVSVELALAKPAQLLSPFDVPAKPEDRKGLDNQNWKRNPESGDWERQVREMSPHSERSVYKQEAASPERARELDAEAAERIRYNVANGHSAIAMDYMEHHVAPRAGAFVSVPAAVSNALPRTDAVTASNGLSYRQDASGAWLNGTSTASGNLALELEMTHRVRQPQLEQFDARMAELQARPAPNRTELESNDLQYRYRIAGNELKPEWQQAIELATARTRADAGIEGRTSQQLLPNASNAFAADSPIAHFQSGADGVSRQVALTTTEDINRALLELQPVRSAGITTAPALTVTAPRPEPSSEEPVLAEKKPSGPDNKHHPDFALLQQIREGVRHEDEKVGKPYDERSEQLSRSVLAACKDNSAAYPNCTDYSLAANAITRADHIVVGKENIFVVQGNPSDPASLRAHVNVGVAMNTPVEVSDAKLESANQRIHQEREFSQQQDAERTRAQQSTGPSL